MNYLLVEDDPVIGKSICRGLREAFHECRWVRDGQAGFDAARAEPFDAIILDIMLPIRPGLEILKELRGGGLRTPVILLSALGTVEERVAGLRAGADDYIVKPFAFAELSARLDAVCRRTADRPSAVVSSASLNLDLATRRVTHQGREIELTPTEFSLLEFLIRHEGNVVTRKMLCEHLWEADWEGETNVIEVHINRLRGKLEKAGAGSPIQTIRGRGYVLRAP
ncbi:MAG: response regulator transcription factor [Planctomycetes bacterium]|nr:response regulator transcription factor [Planctomycetota bacterium]